jgi:hypothetical protein
MLKNI